MPKDVSHALIPATLTATNRNAKHKAANVWVSYHIYNKIHIMSKLSLVNTVTVIQNESFLRKISGKLNKNAY